MNAKLEARLARFDGYLAQDATNIPLALDAFEAALEGGALDRAQAYLDAAGAAGAELPYLQHRQAALFAAQQRYDEALSLQESLCATYPDNADLRCGLASYRHLAGQPEQALAAWRDLIDAGTLPDGARAGWLRSMHAVHHLNDALAWGHANEQTLREQPDAAGVLSLIAADGADWTGAERWSAQALHHLPDSLEAQTAAAAVALSKRDASTAQAHLLRVLTARPAEGRAWSSLGIAHLLLQEAGAARQAFERACALMPGHIGSWHGLGWACLLGADLAGAASAFSHALALDRNFAESHGAVAITAALSGEGSRAREHVELALRLDAKALSPRYAQAVLSGAVQRPEEFVAFAERAMRGVQAPDGAPLGAWVRDALGQDNSAG